MITVYGIKNCNTMKKAFDWLDQNEVEYSFHDYKKTAPDESVIKDAFTAFGWDKVINRAGMTWRNLPDDMKAQMNETSALALAIDKPSVIKRPLIKTDTGFVLGFKEAEYQSEFKG